MPRKIAGKVPQPPQQAEFDRLVLAGLCREVALQIMRHPANVDGIIYRSRHDPSLVNVALFERPHLFPAELDSALVEGASWTRGAAHPGKIVYGPHALLNSHPKLDDALIQLEVARIP